MNILFYLAHPAHYHLFINPIKLLINDNNKVIVLIQKKDILEQLLLNDNIPYYNILPEGRVNNKLGMIKALIKKDIEIFNICRKHKINILISSAPEIAHVGKLMSRPSLLFFEDDVDQVKLFAKTALPFAKHAFAPVSCDVGKWEYKTSHYESYHELAYLHPNYFKGDFNIVKSILDVSKPYYLLRLSALNAYHDDGRTGIQTKLVEKIISRLKAKGNVYITSERELEPQFEKYRLNINPLHIHHVMKYAELYIGDSQTMAAEAAVLGTPSLRFNDFVGKLGYLEELEHRYDLTYGIKTSEPNKLLEKIDIILAMKDVKKTWSDKKNVMLKEKYDLTKYIINSIREYSK